MIGSNEQEVISSVISSFTHQNESLIKQLNQLLYYFRGAFNRDDVWALTSSERDLSIEFINERFKEAGKLIKQNISVFL